MDIVTIQNLQKRFGEKQVLKGLDLSVPENSVFGFVGRNGAGKTTTMKAILGLLPVEGGEILVAGERVRYGQTATNRFVGYLPDVPEFYSFMTAREYLKLCGESLSMERGAIRERSEELLSLVGLSEEKSRIRGYSRGMKQRLGIAQALLSRPRLLICDEPTSALDPIGRKEILDILLAAREHTTVLFSTHILSDVERICTDVAFLHEGRTALCGSVAELRQAHATERFTVEMADPAEAERLRAAFSYAGETEGSYVVFSGGEAHVFEVLDFIRGNQLSLRGLSRTRSSLETLFLEVVEK